MLYHDQIGDAQSPPPYVFPDVSINSFRLSADLEKLTELCDDILNVGELEDRGFEFRPIFPFVDLEIIHYPKMEYGFFPPAGYITQNECCVRLFVMKYIAVGDWLVPDGEISFFCPFLIVDNSWSAFAGRDVLGFPKLLGSFDPSPTTSPLTTVSTEVFTSLTGGVMAAPQPVVKIESAGTGDKAIGADARHWPYGEFDVDLMNLAHRPLGRSLVFDPLIFGCVQMKQFRDPMFPLNACYQAILQSYTFIEATGDLKPLPEARITLTDYPSLQLAARLGIPANTPQTPISQYHMECSFAFGEVVTLYANNSPWWWF
jgi:Acetoacetate decarboxylase (ADC)